MAVVAAVSIGCKVNQYELQALKEFYERREGEWAILLTCCVTEEAERKSRKALRRLLRHHPQAKVVVAGCMVTLRPEAFRGERITALDNMAKNGLLSACGGISRFDGHSRAFLKVADGCPCACSYCIVCRVRGPLRSRDPEDILQEAERLAAAGFREVVLVGVNLAAYGQDRNTDLAFLLRRLEHEKLFPRVRLSSLEPHLITEALLDAIGDCPSVCAHFHLPLQSGSNSVLQHMERPYSTAHFARLVEKLRQARKKPAITTDIIVGYPTETERDFDETLRFVERMGFSRVHIFRFSPRPNTKAAELKPLPGSVVRERMGRLRRVCEEAAARYRRSILGLEETFLRERGDFGMLERYVRARMEGGEDFCRVRVVDVEDDFVIAVEAGCAESR